MSTTANFFSTPRTAVATIATANALRTGAGTIDTIITGAATGTRVDDIEITAVAATTAGVVRLWLHDGTTAFLLREILVQAITPSASVAVWSYRITDLGLILASASWSLRASTDNGDDFNLAVTRAGDA